MSAERLLSRLQGVRETGAGKWIARCPAHDDRSPSLSISAIGDRLLIHCFSGCAAVDIVQAVGLSMSDLFADQPHQTTQPRKPEPVYKQLYLMSQHHGLIMALFVEDIVRGVIPRPDDVLIFQNAYREFCKYIDA